MDNTTLQVPINKKLKGRAARIASRQGFSSLQEAVRIFLSRFADEEVRVSFSPPAVPLSEANEARYTKMADEVLSGKVKTKKFNDVNAMMKYLNK